MKAERRTSFKPRNKREEIEDRRVSDRVLIGRVWGICKELESEDLKIVSMLAILQTTDARNSETGFFLNIGRVNPEIFRAYTILQNVQSDEEKLAFAVAILEGIQAELDS